jgi:hypothetical protein
VDALKLAFDMTIVGALSLPWVALGLYLFVGSQQGRIANVWTVFKENQAHVPPAVAAVALFAAAYFMGAAVSRVSGDFFDDEDLKVPVTESGIRARVYCKARMDNVLEIPPPFTGQSFDERCQAIEERANDTKANDQAELIFKLQESALLMQGGDRLDRLNQLHAQIMVLRGAAFNGMIMCALCLFGMCANQRATNRLVWIIPMAFLALGATALGSHIVNNHGKLDDPPFMECALLGLGVVAVSAVWKGVPRRPYANYLLLSLMLSGFAYFGWWWSEILYDQQVLQSFYVQVHRSLTVPQ